MRQQVLAIIWAQFRITRNHLPRTTFGAVLMWILTALWYALFAGLAVLAAAGLPELPVNTLREALPIALLVLFLYNQTVPLLTLSTGWALQINKLQVYPIRDSALFGLEVLLRVTSTPEFFIVMLGGAICQCVRMLRVLAALSFVAVHSPQSLFATGGARVYRSCF